jgi:hypothetical protein
MIAMGFANFAAGVWYFTHGNAKLAAVVACYGVASFVLATIK